jgi:hypothetical protein
MTWQKITAVKSFIVQASGEIKGLRLTNTLAYYDMTKITAVKCFIVQAPREIKWQKIKTFFNKKNERTQMFIFMPLMLHENLLKGCNL